jgi:hypothetical protein
MTISYFGPVITAVVAGAAIYYLFRILIATDAVTTRKQDKV